MTNFYFKSAARSIGRKKTLSLLNIAGLAIGMAVFLLSLEYYSYETGFNEQTNRPNLYRIIIAGENGKSGSTVPNLAPMMLKNIPGVRQAVRFADNFNSGAILSHQTGSGIENRKSFRNEGCVFVDKAFLDMFHFPLVEGTNQLDKPNTALIRQTVAKSIFGNENAVGKTIELHNQFGELTCKITGIVKDISLQSDIQFDCLFPIETLNNPGYTIGSDWAKLNNWGNDAYTSYVLLDNNSNPAVIAAQASQLLKTNNPNYKKEDGVIQLQPFDEMHLGSSLKDTNPVYGSRLLVYFILGLGILVLGIAWINYINFSTAMALSQAKYIGLHKIIGSSKKQIVIRYITESFLLNITGFGLAFIMVTVVQRLFNYITDKELSLSVIDNPTVWIKGIAISTFGVLLCGGYVGWILARFKPAVALRFNDQGQLGNKLLRRGLVVFQFTISILCIISAIIAYQQLEFMKHHDLGMNIDNLVVIDGPSIKPNNSTFKSSSSFFKNELDKFPFIQATSLTGSVPGLGFSHNFVTGGITSQNPQKGDETKSYFISIVDENYFETYQIRFLSGRNFTTEETARGFKGDKLIINESAARSLGFNPSEALNKTISWGQPHHIIAVVKDYHHHSLKDKIEPIIFIPQHNNACYTVKLNRAELSSSIGVIKRLYEKCYPGNPFSYHILKDSYDKQYSDEQRTGVIALSISTLVILIACMGLVGLSVFTAKRRKKELGIRKILGASVHSLFVLLSKDYMVLVVIALLIASPIAWMLMNKWLLNFAYRINFSGWVIVSAGAIALMIALITISFQSIRSAIANPTKSLRTE